MVFVLAVVIVERIFCRPDPLALVGGSASAEIAPQVSGEGIGWIGGVECLGQSGWRRICIVQADGLCEVYEKVFREY